MSRAYKVFRCSCDRRLAPAAPPANAPETKGSATMENKTTDRLSGGLCRLWMWLMEAFAIGDDTPEEYDDSDIWTEPDWESEVL